MTTAEELIGGAEALLLDFDGPVTTLMPPPLNAGAANRARQALHDLDLPEEIASTSDHLAVLRYTAEYVPIRLTAVERSCTEAELDCASKSEPSPEFRPLLWHAQRKHVPVAIVSNNSMAAVRVFLDRFDWAKEIETLSCRNPMNVRRLKPDPYLVVHASKLLGVNPRDCVLVGDSVSDVVAGQAAGMRVVGLAKTPLRGQQLQAAGADALIERARGL